jgi:hypothetical protein
MYRTAGDGNRSGNDRIARPAYVGAPSVQGPAVDRRPSTNDARPTSNDRNPGYYGSRPAAPAAAHETGTPGRAAPSAPARGTPAAPNGTPATAPNGRAPQGRSEGGAVRRSR